jgi:hypothetical protein
MSEQGPQQDHPVIYCDTIESAGVHNGNARIIMTRFGATGQVVPALELILPLAEAQAFIAALRKLTPD